MTGSFVSNSTDPIAASQSPADATLTGDRAYTFEEICREEQVEIAASRSLRCPGLHKEGAAVGGERDADGHPMGNDLVGVAFSGGGIRSATFNLGIVQALAEKGVLKQIDYLSTISGGGYIGSWLTAWIRRQGCARVEKTLKENVSDAGQKNRYLEPHPIRFIREFSNYLTPRTGTMSLDTWALLAIYLRNLLLNLVLLTSIALCVLLLPLVLIWGFKLAGPFLLDSTLHFDPIHSNGDRIRTVLWGLSGISVAMAAATAGTGLMAFSNKEGLQGWKRRVVEQGAKFNSLGFLVALLFVTLLLGYGPARMIEHIWFWMGIGAASYLLFWSVALGPAIRARLAEKGRDNDFRQHWASFLTYTVIAGAVGGALGYGILELLDWIRSHQSVRAAADAALITFGPPLLIMAIVITQSLHIGLAGHSFDDARREWMARATGALLLTGLMWFVLVGAAVYGPVVMHFLASSRWSHDGWGQFVTWALATGWAGTTLAGLGGGATGSHGKLRRVLMHAAPYVFLLGLVFFLARGSDYVLGRMPWMAMDQQSDPIVIRAPWGELRLPRLNSTARGEVPEIVRPAAASELVGEFQSLGKASNLREVVHAFSNTEQRLVSLEGSSLSELAEHHWRTVENYSDTRLIVLFSLFVLLVLVLERRLDVNEFSMQLFYRNRLVRAYLGASKRRAPHLFTGFSDSDDLALQWLRADQVLPRESLDGGDQQSSSAMPYDGPYPILGTALNIVHGKQLAWQSRKATSFIFTPRFCGYDFFAASQDAGQELDTAGYRRTEHFAGAGGPTLGTALGISGAAASPNMGYHSSTAISALMTICNVRMGWWVGNPRHPKTWKHRGPSSALRALLNELLGNTNDEGEYVYLSDGGHFENLGIYELVRRKCRYMIACDGAQDREMTFQDLGDAIEKCRRDFGAEIKLDVSRLRRQEKSRLSSDHCAWGQIVYHDGSMGEILYIKASLTGDEPLDVTAYASSNEAFPHDSTANQFFSEIQFESYRALGQHIFRQLAADVENSPNGEIEVPKLFQGLQPKLKADPAAAGQ